MVQKGFRRAVLSVKIWKQHFLGSKTERLYDDKSVWLALIALFRASHCPFCTPHRPWSTDLGVYFTDLNLTPTFVCYPTI